MRNLHLVVQIVGRHHDLLGMGKLRKMYERVLDGGQVSANKDLLAGTVPANKELLDGRVPANNLFLKGISQCCPLVLKGNYLP